jgi:hypothetical protein
VPKVNDSGGDENLPCERPPKGCQLSKGKKDPVGWDCRTFVLPSCGTKKIQNPAGGAPEVMGMIDPSVSAMPCHECDR